MIPYKTESEQTSPSRICVAASIPVLGGTNRGEGGRSRNASVWASASISTVLSVSSSRYSSVCTSMCCLPSTASGCSDTVIQKGGNRRRRIQTVFGLVFSATRVRAAVFRRVSCCFWTSIGSACAD